MLYIHIPFCDSKCFYCAFNSYTTKNQFKDVYFEAIQKQFETEKKPKKFNSIFIGGGTPSVMSIQFYEKLFKMLDSYFDKKTEITIELNPNSTKIEFLKERAKFDFEESEEFGAPVNKLGKFMSYRKFHKLEKRGLHYQLFEKVFSHYQLGDSPLVCVTPVLDGEILAQ